MFWQRFYDLCAEKGTKPNPVCRELGFSSATATHWKAGQQPGSASLDKLAKYFGVSVDYLLGKTDKKETTTPEEQSLSSEQQLLLSFCKDLAVDDLKKVIEYVELLKLKGNQ